MSQWLTLILKKAYLFDGIWRASFLSFDIVSHKLSLWYFHPPYSDFDLGNNSTSSYFNLILLNAI